MISWLKKAFRAADVRPYKPAVQEPVQLTAVRTPADNIGTGARAPVVETAREAKPHFDAAAFFAVLRTGSLRHAKPTQVEGTNAIVHAMMGAPLSWTAYALATAWLETNKTMQPVRESYWLPLATANAYAKRRYDIKGDRPDKAKELGNTVPGDGARYMGRGYVQLTGRTNYDRAAKKTGFPLVGNPDLAMRQDIAALVMREGMTGGWFTGRGFVHFLPSQGPATAAQFTQARRIINGLDKAKEIGGFALAFQAALIRGNWRD